MNWTAEQKQEAAKLWNDGHTASQIAPRFGVKRNSIISLAYRNRDIFNRVGPSIRVKSGGRAASVWTDEALATAEKQWNAGQSLSLIAMTAGVSEMSVKGMMCRERARFPLRRTGRPGKGSIKGSPEASRAGRKAVEPPKKVEALPIWEDGKEGAARLDLSQYRLQGCEAVVFAALGRDMCRFPLVAFDADSGPDMPCCGAKTDPLASYCHAHRRVMGGRV